MATIIFKQGDTIEEVLSITSKEDAIIDISESGAIVKFRIVTAIDDVEAEAIFTDEDVPITDGAAGEATLAIARLVTKAWTPGDYFWEVEYIDGSTNYSHSDSDILIIEKSIYSEDS